MSLSIDTDQICAVYALGEWHRVKPGSFFIDAYELCEDLGAGRQNHYILGNAYDLNRRVEIPSTPGSIGEHWNFQAPQGYDGCQWTDPVSNQSVCLSLLEIKAWKLQAPSSPEQRIEARAISPRTRWAVLHRDNYKCSACGASGEDAPLEVDHIVAVANGGSADIDNLTTLCKPCNSGKGAA